MKQRPHSSENISSGGLPERRRSPPLRRDERILTRTVTSTEDPPLTTIFCSAVDVSAKGMQVYIDHVVPLGSGLELSVELRGSSRPFVLAGKVKWVHETEYKDSYLLGVELVDAQSPDIERWVELFK